MAAMAVAGVLFLSMDVGMIVLSRWAESEVGAHPFKKEDWLRFLLSSRLDREPRAQMMLAGPSTVRENFRIEEFQAAFPDHAIFQGGLSQATIEDTLLSLRYIERTIGKSALPDIIVLGVSPRFLSGVPEERPFQRGVNLYSESYSLVRRGDDLKLVPKGLLKSLRARVKFLSDKQADRYRTALFATTYHWLGSSPGARELGEQIWRVGAPLFIAYDERNESARKFGLRDELGSQISPYKYEHLKPQNRQWVHERLIGAEVETWWAEVFVWDAKADSHASRRLAEFMTLVEENDIRLVVVNMPERAVARELYRTDYQDYLDLVMAEVDPSMFLDLREFLGPGDFFDAEHAVRHGSFKVTSEVIAFIQSRLGEGEGHYAQSAAGQ